MIVGLIGGLLMGLFVSTVFYAVQWNREHQRANDIEAENKQLEAKVTHLQGLVRPEEWLHESDVAINIAKKERLYDRHPELLRPGTETVIIEDMEDY